MTREPLAEVKPPLVVEVALTSAASQAEQAVTAAPPPPINPVVNKQQPKPPEKVKIKPVAKPKVKPVAKPHEPKKPIPKDTPNKAAPTAETLQAFDSPPVFTPAPANAPAKAGPSPIATPKPQSLVKGAYSAPGLKNPPTRYPKIAQMRQWEGDVTLDVWVLTNGSAGTIKIVKSSGHEILDESAVEQVKSWHFIPAHRGDKTVEDWVRVPISFKFKR